jgi:hypothetical protein
LNLKRTTLLFICAAVTNAIAAAPNFTVPDSDLQSSPVIIAYGDTRFTHPAEKEATNPKVRRWLVDRIASEKPDAVLISGDLPWHGANAADYAVFHEETQSWRDRHLRIYPALGNHEMYSHSIIENRAEGLANWWAAFPILKEMRWYSVQLGSSLYALNLDSNSGMHAGSEQISWIEGQIASLPPSVRFLFINLHHPPVADYQRFGDPTHNPRGNEIGLGKYLEHVAGERPALRIVVIAGHIHNYERFETGGVTFLVSGGGGAAPRAIHRGPKDLYQDKEFPNYHYVKFVLTNGALDATMFRVADPAATTPVFEVKDHFVVK